MVRTAIGVLLVVVCVMAGCKAKKPEKIERAVRTEVVSGYDPTARERLIAKIGADAERLMKEGALATSAPVLVSLEDFFEGNQDLGSIGCNLEPHPGIDRFYSTLKAIRDREDVQDVRVEINSIEEDAWPFSECVWIFSRANRGAVEKWMKPLGPDEVWEGWQTGGPAKTAPVLEKGMKVFGAWWD